MKIDHFWMLVLEGLVGLHRTVQLQLLSVTGQGIDLDYCDIEWLGLEMNRDHLSFFIYKFIYFNWRLITLQYMK